MFNSKKLLTALLLLLVSPCWATWTNVQTKTATGCGGTTCAVVVTATGAGHVLIAVGIGTNTTSTTISSVSGGGTWTHPAGCAGLDATAGNADVAYTLNSTAGATVVTITFTASQPGSSGAIYEFSGTGSGFAFDSCGNRDQTTAVTSLAAVTLALGTANNYILAQGSLCGGTCSAIDQAYTGTFPGGDAMAFKLNVTSFGTTPNWTQTSGRGALTGIAIYEVVATPKKCTLAVMGAGPC